MLFTNAARVLNVSPLVCLFDARVSGCAIDMRVKTCHNTLCRPKAVSYRRFRVPVSHVSDERFSAAKCCLLERPTMHRSRDSS
jgi:hypothetical protein